MARFLGRWLSDTLRLGLALVLAISAMQVPALTDAYTLALQQIAADARRDIDQRKDIARQHYRWTDAGSDSAVISALRPVEPANAEGLQLSVEREQVLRDTHDRLMERPALLRPLAALQDLLADERGGKRAVLSLAVGSHTPQVVLGTAAAIYGLAGLMTGLLLAQGLLTLLGAVAGRRRDRAPLPRIRGPNEDLLRR
jgi:hypothetical protein